MAEWDIIVAGAGGAGLAAAVEAAERGASVLVVEKAPTHGGATSFAVGAYTSSSTPHQKRSGVDDSVQQHFADMDLVNAAANRADNLALRKLLVEEAPKTMEWLTKLGVEFIGPNLETPHTQPRMHNVVPTARSLTYHTAKRCRELGVKILCSCSLVDLHFEGNRVAGIVAETDGRREVFRCRNAVILATGDFSASKEFRQRYFRDAAVCAEPVYPFNTGDAQRIAEQYGGSIVNGDYHAFYLPRMRFVPPKRRNLMMRLPPNKLVGRTMRLATRILPNRLLRPFLMCFITTFLGPEPDLFAKGAALIDAKGNLVPVDVKSPAEGLALHGGNLGYIVMDQRLSDKFSSWPNFVSTAPNVAYAYMPDYRNSRRDIYHEAPTLGRLASAIGIPANALTAAIARHQ